MPKYLGRDEAPKCKGALIAPPRDSSPATTAYYNSTTSLVRRLRRRERGRLTKRGRVVSFSCLTLYITSRPLVARCIGTGTVSLGCLPDPTLTMHSRECQQSSPAPHSQLTMPTTCISTPDYETLGASVGTMS